MRDKAQIKTDGVSIHASVKDATRARHLTLPNDRCFNPRVREGRDVSLGDRLLHPLVSIHASVKDATKRSGCAD